MHPSKGCHRDHGNNYLEAAAPHELTSQIQKSLDSTLYDPQPYGPGILGQYSTQISRTKMTSQHTTCLLAQQQTQDHVSTIMDVLDQQPWPISGPGYICTISHNQDAEAHPSKSREQDDQGGRAEATAALWWKRGQPGIPLKPEGAGEMVTARRQR